MNYTNKKVIIRSTYAGVFYGTLEEKTGNEVVLSNCRRIWYWDGASSISQLAVDGVSKPKTCKFTISVEEMYIAEVIEIIPCTKKAIESIETVPVWKQ